MSDGHTRQLADGFAVSVKLTVDEDACNAALVDDNQAAEVEAGLERALAEVKRMKSEWKKMRRRAERLRAETGKLGG